MVIREEAIRESFSRSGWSHLKGSLERHQLSITAELGKERKMRTAMSGARCDLGLKGKKSS